MKQHLRKWLAPWLCRTETVAIADCVHYCGFRYGRGELNPYENYVLAIAAGENEAGARGKFIAFLRGYRPRHLAEALGIALGREYALWNFPWAPPLVQSAGPRDGWLDNPAEVPDILTHFSTAGILRRRIDQEFAWLESAYRSIREHGYLPARFGGDIEVRKLIGIAGDSRYLVTDGNHRLSALVALGRRNVRVRMRRRATVRESALKTWPQVRAGKYSEADARELFRAYFAGNRQPKFATEPAAIIEEEVPAP